MPVEDKEKNSFRRRFLNKKVLIIVVIMLVVAGAGGNYARLKASEIPGFCNLCHSMKSYYQSWDDSNLLAHQHAAEDITCHDCHQASFSDQVHELVLTVSGNVELPLEKREFSREFCLECHDDFESIQMATEFEESNPHDSHNGEQECYLCHSMHRQSKPMCVECHLFDWFDELDNSWTLEDNTPEVSE